MQQQLPCDCSDKSLCTAGLPSGASASHNATEHSTSATGQPASQQLQDTNLLSAPSLQEAAPGLPAVQHTASTGEAQAGPQADTQAGTQAGPQANQQNLVELSQTVVNQTLQQHCEGTQSSPQQHKQQPHQHGTTSEMPRSATEATAARPPGQYAWLRPQAAESPGGSGRSVEPVAVLTSAVTGAGLKELLLQVERKVSSATIILLWQISLHTWPQIAKNNCLSEG